MFWFAAILVICLLALAERHWRRHAESMARQERYLRQISNTVTMQFYALEQMYEMSGLHARFSASCEGKPSESLGPEPVEDVDDAASLDAWNTLLSRMNDRMESTVRMQLTRFDPWPHEEGVDVDHDMLRGNGAAWRAAVPMLRGWPEYPRACWFGAKEDLPEDVPYFAKD